MIHRLTLLVAAIGGAFVLGIVGYIVFISLDAAPGDAFFNPTRAMEPTLLVGERFTVRLIDGDRRAPIRRNELVVHAWPVDRSKRFVKRIVGLPGDTLAMLEGRLHVNGKTMSEPNAWHEDSTVDPASDEFHWQRAHLVGPAARDTAQYSASRNNWDPFWSRRGCISCSATTEIIRSIAATGASYQATTFSARPDECISPEIRRVTSGGVGSAGTSGDQLASLAR